MTVPRIVVLEREAHPLLVKRFLAFAPAAVALLSGKGPAIWFVLPCTPVRRSDPHQAALYMQGREALAVVNLARREVGLAPITAAQNDGTVTNADGTLKRSNHQGFFFRSDGSRCACTHSARNPWRHGGLADPAPEATKCAACGCERRSTALDILLTTDPDGDEGPKPAAPTWERAPYLAIGTSGLAAAHGLRWGGRSDAPHYELPKGAV